MSINMSNHSSEIYYKDSIMNGDKEYQYFILPSFVCIKHY